MNEMSATLDAAIYRLGWMLVHSIWQAALAAGVLAIALRAGRRWMSASLRYLLSYSALLMIVVATAATAMLVKPPVAPERVDSRISAVRLSDSPVIEASAAMPNDTAKAIAPAISWQLENALPWLVGVWAIGVVLLSAWQFGGWLILQRWCVSAQPVDREMQQRVDQLAWKMAVQRVLFRLSSHVDVPIVIGFWRPVILAPLGILNDLSPGQLEAILAHELAHVRRFDYVANLIHVAIETILFYHPAIWWISGQIRLERECCCDELAASACGDRTEYVQALAAMERTRGPQLAPAITGRGGRGELLMRVRRLLGVSQGTTGRGIFELRSWATAALLLVVLSGIVAGGRFLQAQQQPTTAPSRGGNVADQPLPADAAAPQRQEQNLAAPPFAQPNLVTNSVQPADLVPGPVEDYRITRNDLLQVSVSNLTAQGVQTQKVARVSESGFISLPLVGQIKAEGLTEAQMEQAIDAMYRDKNLLVNAQASVSVADARGRVFTIGGAVARPGQYMMSGSRFTLFDALAIAGGAEKGTVIRVHRRVAGSDEPRLIDIPAEPLQLADPKVNIIIKPGDAVWVINLTYNRAAASNVPEMRAQARRVAAEEDAWKAIQQVEQGGAAMTADFVGQQLDVVKRVYEARLAAAGAAQDARIIAARDYLQECIRLNDILLKRMGQDVSRVQLSQAAADVEAARAALAREMNSTETSMNSRDEQAARILMQQLIEAKIATKEAEATLGPGHIRVTQARQQEAAIQKMLDEVDQKIEKTKQSLVAAAPNDQVQVGEYYMGGEVQRTGVYSLTGRQITLRQAIISAGAPTDDRPYYVSIYRKTNFKDEYLIHDVPLKDFFDQTRPDILLKPDDQITVNSRLTPAPPTTKPTNAQSQVIDATAKVNAQATAWNNLNQRMQQGEALSSDFVRLLLDTSERLAAAQMDGADNWHDRVATFEEHLTRCVQLADIVYKRQGRDTTKGQLSLCNAAVESARDRLIRIKANARAAGEPQ